MWWSKMISCKFEKYGWRCPLEAKDGSEYCYWHQEIDKKKPTSEQLIELISHKIKFVYLRKGYLSKANLQGADLNVANLQEANLVQANLQEADLIYANLQRANLIEANLQGADLIDADLQGANLSFTNLQGASLIEVNLQGVDLVQANLQQADLIEANLQRANLINAKLQGADLTEAKLQEAYLKNTFFDSNSRLDEARLKNANFHLSYIDFAKSFRNASPFEQIVLNEKEINELIADTCYLKGRGTCQYGKGVFFDFEKIKNSCTQINHSDLFLKKLKELCVIRLGKKTNMVIEYKKVIRAYEEEKITIEEKQFFDNLFISKSCMGISFLVPVNEDLLAEIDKLELYEASKEVYSKLYHFYSDEGMNFRTKHAHYRRAEVDRKLLLVRHKLNSFEGLKDRARSWLFDWLVLKILTGYGESILRPVLISIFWIIAFGFIYMALEGVKVAGRAANWFDYFYLSMTTFTSLGFADVQPNVSVTGMQPLIMAESTMGVAMVALIIFVITYQISR